MIWNFIAICIAYIIVMFDILGTSVLLPKMQPALNLSFAQMQWVINIYVIVIASMILVAGKLANRIGYRRFFLQGIVIFAAASLVCGFATNAEWEIIGRALQGIGASIIFPVGVAIMKRISPPDRTSEYLGFFLSITAATFAFGGTVAGLFADYWNWRFFFFLNVPVAIFAYVLLSFCLKRMITPERVPIDWLGLIVLLITIIGFVFGFMNAPLYGWNSWWIIGSLIVGHWLIQVRFKAHITTGDNPH